MHSTEPGVRAQLLSHQSAETALPILRLHTFSKTTSFVDCCGGGASGTLGALSGAGCGSGSGALTPFGAAASWWCGVVWYGVVWCGGEGRCWWWR